VCSQDPRMLPDDARRGESPGWGTPSYFLRFTV
jgi:hypothetical protein